ncbi:MAG: pyridoxal 5'-phosphate synthase glutaminase subunit PdxT [Calditrichaeota bacterium]|nr:pyridoxal 5'-phosphate synthase glutaminase subunit PdxT [Calditrichota bacterium]
MKFGILALQGDFALHQKALQRVGIETQLVRKPEHLTGLMGLIMPGGESTTFVKLLKEIGLFDAIREFAKNHVIFGTCAGLITLARKIVNYDLETLNLIDIVVERNAYGRQIDSFVDTVRVSINHTDTFEGVFIRAPKIIEIGQGVTALGYHQNDVVMAENDRILVATFHPELTDDLRIHEYFIQKARELK